MIHHKKSDKDVGDIASDTEQISISETNTTLTIGSTVRKEIARKAATMKIRLHPGFGKKVHAMEENYAQSKWTEKKLAQNVIISFFVEEVIKNNILCLLPLNLIIYHQTEPILIQVLLYFRKLGHSKVRGEN